MASKRSGKICHHHERAFKYTHKKEIAALIVLGYFNCQFANTLIYLFFREKHASKIGSNILGQHGFSS
jgi:hypothetical protein